MIPKLNLYKDSWGVHSDSSIKPGLDSIIHALMLLGNPHKDLNVVHIAGTNGKGSTLSFIENIALAHGLTVGKFMSPCIIDVHDQIQINGVPITEQEMNEIFSFFKESNIEGLLTDFELLTCAAFVHFNNKQVDLVLLEAGMGGREDSTNVIMPIVSVIPSISLEHTRFLGNSIESIAGHKAGIIKKNRPVVIGNLPNSAIEVIEKEAVSKDAPLYRLGIQFQVELTSTGDRYINERKSIHIEEIHRSLLGNHQSSNMALAITSFLEVADYFQLSIDIDKVRKAIANTKVPGRFEEVINNVYFDGAHNPESATQLVRTIEKHFPSEKIIFVVGMLADKDVKSVLSILETTSNHFYFVDFSNPRAMNAEEMFNLSNATEKHVLKDYLPFIQKASLSNGKTIVTGSLYLLAEIRQQLLCRK
ncbi:bifunctional folylpolyglutamate synthase/dihydrofolate synthase [Ureibacillus acetophenoni]|uniref:tetrahydrofolate synthase n=1 Tax=Ureibacillus acetophenoni TaxID=614649 RepID=A0A285U3Y9_9BACL|nr:folylpolyglutamate synthase/dihydrofolate synthase family protein [Ureibacillus acetophenoni]SOC36433.1 dihydrofolate synthase/folylpolyglutamate synthase [Ureibacillus acetophenoni]